MFRYYHLNYDDHFLFWSCRVPVLSRNTHQIMFQIVELAVALWFPCCLWNCIRPEQLWILNPRKILKRDRRRRRSKKSSVKVINRAGNESDSFIGENENDADDEGLDDLDQDVQSRLECWICYDNEKDAPLMQPCNCKGDVSAVHHECLKQWLMESHFSTENIRCQVCKQLYNFSRGQIWLPAGLTLIHYLRSALILSIMVISLLATYVIIKRFEQVSVRTMSVGIVILIQYVCLRCLGINLISAYQRARFAAIQIRGRVLDQNDVTESDLSEQPFSHLHSMHSSGNGMFHQLTAHTGHWTHKSQNAVKGKSDRSTSNEHRQKLLSFIRATLNEQLSHDEDNPVQSLSHIEQSSSHGSSFVHHQHNNNQYPSIHKVPSSDAKSFLTSSTQASITSAASNLTESIDLETMVSTSICSNIILHD